MNSPKVIQNKLWIYFPLYYPSKSIWLAEMHELIKRCNLKALTAAEESGLKDYIVNKSFYCQNGKVVKKLEDCIFEGYSSTCEYMIKITELENVYDS